jgi:hypothetical protein
MDTIAFRAPRLSRAKALIGALLASLAIAGAVQATAPESASAMRSCDGYRQAGDIANAQGRYSIALTWYRLFWGCMGLPTE